VCIQSKVTETLRPFYCTVCEKPFQNVAQYDKHCNSYAHYHKIRFKEMQSSKRAEASSREAIEERRENERKREEKELRKTAKAAGVKPGLTQPTETCFTAASPTSRTTSRYDGSSSTHDVYIQFQGRRLDDARRTLRPHPLQTDC